MKSRINLAVLLALALCLNSGCISMGSKIDGKSQKEVVEFSNGSKFGINGTGREALQSAIFFINKACNRDGGVLSDQLLVGVRFTDRFNERGPIYASLPSRLVCVIGGKDSWGAEISVDDSTFVASTIGGPFVMYGTLKSSYISGIQLSDEATAAAALQQRKQIELVKN